MKPTSTTETKTCKTCEQNKPVDEFYRANPDWPGIMYQASCKECQIKKAKERYHQKAMISFF